MQVTLFLLFSNWEKSIFTAERVSQREGPPFFTAHALRLLAIFVFMLSQSTLQIASYCVLGHKYFLPYKGWHYCKIATIDLTPIPLLLSRPLLLSLVIPRKPPCFIRSDIMLPTPHPTPGNTNADSGGGGSGGGGGGDTPIVCGRDLQQSAETKFLSTSRK